MEFGAFLDPRALPQLLAVALMLALAGGLLATRFNDRVNRAFALFLVLRGGAMALGALAAIEPDEALSQYWSRVNGYFHLASFAALIAFLAVYPRRWKLARRVWPGIGLAAATLALLLAYARDKCIWFCADPSAGLTRIGPVAIVPLTLVLAVMGLYLVREHLAAAPGPRREALLIVGAIFVLNALFDGARSLGDLQAARELGLPAIRLVATPWAWATFVASPLALLPSLLAVALLARHWSKGGVVSTRGRRAFFLGAALALATGLLLGVFAAGALRGSWGVAVIGLWRITIPLAVTYAIMRHQLFDIDVRVKITIERSAIVAVFGAAFFVGAELLEELIPVDSRLLGLASAGLIALVLKPIERYAHRLAERALPEVREKDPDYVTDRKLDVYRAAVESALEEGGIDAKERAVLARLRGKLGVSDQDAARVETSLGMRSGATPA